MTQDLEQWIMAKEGLRLKCYNDSHGFLSIGWGHNLASNGIPIEIADRLLEIDIANAQKQVMANLPWAGQIGMPRFDALVHLCFWVGIGSLMGFKNMLAALKIGDWQTAHDELINSNLHDNIPERTEEIATRILTGDTP